MAFTILIAIRKCRPLGKLKLKLRMVKMLLDLTMEVAISPVAASQLVSRAASDNAPAQTSHNLATRNYLPSPSPCSTNS